MTEATIFGVFLAESWPPDDVTDISHGKTPLGSLVLRVAPTGSIAFIAINDENTERTLFEGQPVAFSGPPHMIFSVVSGDGTAVWINGTNLSR